MFVTCVTCVACLRAFVRLSLSFAMFEKIVLICLFARCAGLRCSDQGLVAVVQALLAAGADHQARTQKGKLAKEVTPSQVWTSFFALCRSLKLGLFVTLTNTHRAASRRYNFRARLFA